MPTHTRPKTAACYSEDSAHPYPEISVLLNPSTAAAPSAAIAAVSSALMAAPCCLLPQVVISRKPRFQTKQPLQSQVRRQSKLRQSSLLKNIKLEREGEVNERKKSELPTTEIERERNSLLATEISVARERERDA